MDTCPHGPIISMLFLGQPCWECTGSQAVTFSLRPHATLYVGNEEILKTVRYDCDMKPSLIHAQPAAEENCCLFGDSIARILCAVTVHVCRPTQPEPAKTLLV